MPLVTFKISRRWARMLAMLGKDVVEVQDADGRWTKSAVPLSPEQVLEYILEVIDLGVFWPDSDPRQLVRSLFGEAGMGRVGDPSKAASWESMLVPSEKVEGGALLRFAGPRSLCADIADSPDAVFVYRPSEPDDHAFKSERVQIDGDFELPRKTEDGLTRARTEHRSTVVYHLHESAALGAWFHADRRAERASLPSPPIPTPAQLAWTKVRMYHSVLGLDGMECGLPRRPDRDVRGDPFWR